MADPFPIQQQWLGIDRDHDRTGMRQSSSYNLQDYIPMRLDAPLRKRGGWSYFTTGLGASTFVDVLTHAPFTAAAKLLAIGSDANLYDCTSGTPSSIGASVTGLQNPTFFNQAIVMLATDGTTTGKTYDTGGGLLALGGTPPTARYSTVFKGRLAVANTAAFPTSVYFAPVGWGPNGVGGTWDTTFATTTTSQTVTGLGSTLNSIIVFHDASSERLRGTIPFGTTNSDMALESLWGGVGCVDARSIVNWNEQLLWADTRGVYQTDGAALRDLTTLTGMKSLWRSALASWSKPSSSSTGYRIAGGIYRDHYIVAITNQSGSTPFFVDCFVFDLANQLGYRFQNFPARAFARSVGTTDELYMALAHQGKVGTVSSCWSPTGAVKNDADGVAVLPVWESMFYRGYQRFHRRWIQSMALQRWRFLYPSYECVDAAADAPFLTMSVAAVPDLGSTYATTLVPTLTATTAYTRKRLPVSLPANGIAVKIAQTNPSADTRLYALEADYAPVEGDRLS